MKRLLLQTTVLSLVVATASLNAATKYWDINGATAGAGGATPTGNWDTTTANWSTSSAGTAAATTWAASDNAVFSAGSDASGTFVVTTTAAQTAGSITVEEGTVQHSGTSANTLTTSGLTINSGATFSLNIALSFTPTAGSACTLNGGTIQNRNTGVGSSFLSSSGANGNMGIVLGTGGGHVSASGGASAITIYTGLISGTGPLTVDGNGTFRLTTTPATYSGATIINTKFQLSTTANTLPSATDVTVNSGGTLDVEQNQTIGSLSGAGSLLFVNSGTTLTCGNSLNTTFSGPVTGPGIFTKVGTGTLTIQGNDWANTSASGVNINAGTIKYGNSAAGLSSSTTVTIASGATLDMNSINDTFGALAGAGSVINNSGSTGLHVGANNTASTTFSGVIGGTGAVEKQGTGTLVLSGPNTYSGKTTVSGGTLTINTSGDSCLGAAPASPVADQLILNAGATFSLGSAANATLNANRGITLGGAATISLSSKDLTVPGIIAGTGPLTKSGGNILILSGANTFSGGVTLTGGTLTVNNNTALGSGTVTITPAGICTIAGKSGTTTLANPITVNAGGGQVIDFFATSGNNLTLNGQISGSAAIFRGNGGGSGNVTLNGNNSTYSGTLTLAQGPLVLGHKNALGTGTFVVTPGAVAISLGANTTLTGANAVANAVTLNGTLPVSTTSDLELAGIVSGALGAVTKSGVGTLVLSAANTYGGDTTINAGTLALSGSGSVASPNLIVGAGATLDVSGHTGGTYTLASGQTLKGNGTVLGQIIVPAGATLAPGTSIGTLTADVPPTLGGATSMEITNFSGTTGSDKLIVSSGALAYGGALNVTLLTGSTPLAGGEIFDLFDATSFGGAFTATNLPALAAGLNWWTDNLYVDGSITVNRAPVAQNHSYSRAKGTSLKIAKADLISDATDADSGSGDTVAYDSLQSLGTQGATVTEDATFVYYAPANDNSDTLQFRVKDTRGGLSTTKNIQINVVAATGQAQSIVVSGSTATVSFAGIPATGYLIQRSTNLVDWVTIETTNAPSNGVFDYTDNFSDLGVPPDPVPSAAYYRLSQP